jgi:hypothetical protein
MKNTIINYCALLLLIIPVFLTGCSKDYFEAPRLDLNDTVSFSQTLIPMFEASCISSGCHNTGGVAPDLTSENAYSSLILYNLVDTASPEQSVLYVRMNATINPMPPDGKLSDLEIARVLAWITQGANDN